MTGQVPKEQRNLTGMNYNYRNYAAIYGRSHHVGETVRNSYYNIEKYENSEIK
jgi:hypothetical protein